MLGKLFKYDMAALTRVLAPLHLAALGVALLAAVCGLAGNGLGQAAHQASGSAGKLFGMFAGFAFMAFGVCLFLLLVLTLATFFVAVHRFYANLFTDEGYLTLTLPVTAHQIVISKVLAAALWLLVDFLVVGACVAMVLFAMDVFSEILSRSDQVGLPSLPTPSEWLSFAHSFLQIIAWLIAAYAALAAGSAAARHKVAASIGAFLLIAVAVGVVMALLNVFAFSALSALAPAYPIGSLDPYGPASNMIGNVVMVALAACSYVACVVRLKRHVNLA
ncbi:hypothetical protein [Enteroscipio rubneri]|uniref:Uncharacterized protein n=1 Tax=Enteroscipio rubneri TaxID=2070686 RepID=A0A2K2U9A3_9ACTN|nr:hypothetical protein [Enteroscipio rubneri]PNV66750.1 hypothetical protein C2L71_11425 [Enteroscipio rubneri]